MNVLILGGGGRENALALAIAKSKRLGKLFVAPGNPGCETVARRVELDPNEPSQVVTFCQVFAIDLVVVGPEAPLVAGVADELAKAGVACFGPNKDAARLEASKGFTKEFCKEFGIPTAAYRHFSDPESALAYVRAKGAPIVVKADGLASGKGVVVAVTLAEAEAAIDSLFGGAFGAAGSKVVIEEFLQGEEASLFAISDGSRVLFFGGAQDHKRLGDGDTGPNTGGMGAYSPAPILSEAVVERAMREIVRPTIVGMSARGAPFRGVLFAGLMIGDNGPQLIEFNVRFGDPETEALLARFDDDLLDFLYGAATGKLPDREPKFSDQAALTVIMAAKGYPGVAEKGARIQGLERAAEVAGVAILHAGTKRVGDAIFADGGRVLAVTALGADIVVARERAYAAIAKIDFPGGIYRRDIAARALNRRPTS
jgi:phosphoribosylamine--glycine ligase